MTTPTTLTATIGPAGQARQATAPGYDVVLRIVNASDSTVVLLNPDLGKPSPEMEWPWSVETYRAALLLSYGFLELTVTEAVSAGRQLERQPLETWATPVLRPPVTLQPGEAVEVPVPLGRIFELTPGRQYRVTATYGQPELRVTAEGVIDVSR